MKPAEMEGNPDEPRVARLEARVAALEAALRERSRLLRLLQAQLCRRDLVLLSRIESGLPSLPFGDFEPTFWSETVVLAPADVEETLTDLWQSLQGVSSPLPRSASGER